MKSSNVTTDSIDKEIKVLNLIPVYELIKVPSQSQSFLRV